MSLFEFELKSTVEDSAFSEGDSAGDDSRARDSYKEIENLLLDITVKSDTTSDLLASTTKRGSAYGHQPKGKLSLSWAGKDAKLIGTEDGKYEWVGNNDVRVGEVRCLAEVEQVTSTVSNPTPGATDDNMLIVGDSADALRVLLKHPDYASKYRRKVKLVYIDPPFNTGQAFDHYDDGLEHSVWMTMMRDRLVQIRDLLAEDGSVWVHLDDAEMAYCKVIMDEVFGRQSFVATIAWQKIHGRDNRASFSKSQDYIMIYAPSGKAWKDHRNLIPRTQAEIDASYSNIDNDPRGPWTSGDMSAQGGHGTESQFYDITLPSGRVVSPSSGRCWLYTREVFEKNAADNRIWFGKTGDGVPRIKRFLSEVQDGMVPTTWWTFGEVGSNDTAKKEIKSLIDVKKPFDTPKPEQLMERIINIGSNPGDIVLDCFAGSGTTAAVAHKLGRQWVTVELSPETASNFTSARLQKVVSGEDEGGITYSMATPVPTAEDFPENSNIDEIKSAYKVLDSLVKAGLLESSDPTVQKMKALSKSKKTASSKIWNGGGSFGLYVLAPSIYSVDSRGHAFIPEDVTPEIFREAMRVHCGFKKDPLLLPPFAGRQGKLALATVNGMVSESEVAKIAALATPGMKVRIVARAYTTGAEELLDSLHPGSYLEKTPDDFFSDYAGVK